jgi:hypothetical protein
MRSSLKGDPPCPTSVVMIVTADCSILRYAKLAETSATTNAASIGNAAAPEASIVMNELPKCCDVHRPSLEPTPNPAAMVQDTGAREISPRQPFPGCLDLGQRNRLVLQAHVSLPTRSRIAEMPQSTKPRMTWYPSDARPPLAFPQTSPSGSLGNFFSPHAGVVTSEKKIRSGPFMCRNPTVACTLA